MELNKQARQIFKDALENHHPEKLVEEKIQQEENALLINGERCEVPADVPVYVIAVGKASRPMAAGLKKKLGVDVSNICCITSDADPDESYSIASTHPAPDQKSRQAAESLIKFIEQIPDGATIIFAISGGTSALICKPAGGLELEDVNEMNRMLLESGANIREINSVRKHLSAIKGGQLLAHFKWGCTLIDLAISDVPSDDMEIIGSGPTTPDSSTFQDAYDTLLRYNLWEETTEAVRNRIEKGLSGEVPETTKPGKDSLKNHSSYIIGSARIFAEHVAAEAEHGGLKPWIADSAYNQSVGKMTDVISKKIDEYYGQNDEPVALIFYGESTVEVNGKGKGGRNQELALRGALKIDGMKNVTWLSAGTDGIDGPTDAAGGIVDGSTLQKAKEKGLNAEEFIQNNDSYHFHEQMGTLLKTGPTGNNVMDMVIVLIGVLNDEC